MTDGESSSEIRPGAGDTVLVTGVSGFVGSAVARAAAAAGYRVRGLARASSLRANLAHFPGELVEGDARDEVAMARALAGARVLFQVAADYRIWAPDPEEIGRNNLAMTGAAMRAALAAGVERVVYTGSVATLKPGDHGPVDETAVASASEAAGAYKRSKVVACELVARMVADEGLPAVTVLPSTPIGPRDAKPTPTGRIIVEAANGRMPAYVDSGLNLVHVDDVAAGHLLALEKGVVGERYILGGADVMLGDMLAEIARAAGRRAPKVRLPITPLVPFAILTEAFARITRTSREPFLTRDSLAMARHRMFFSSARAQAELGYRARPWQDGIADALAWFRQAGMVR